MKILYGIPGSSIGGGVNVVLEHVSRLIYRGHDVYVLNLIGNIDVSWNPITDYTILSRYDTAHVELLRAQSFDVIVATGWQTVFELLDLGLRSRSFYYFLQADEAEFNPRGSLDWRLARYTRELPFQYISCAHWLQRLVPDFECSPVINGLNHDIFQSDFSLIPRTKRTRILIEGPISQPRKRIDDAFLACLPVRDLIEVWCVSSGGEPAEWHRPDMYFAKVPMMKMRHIYSACDVIIKLSSAEGMFGPPLEMMACGGTAITSNCDGHEEYMRHGVNGLVVNVGDIAAATDAIRQIATDGGLLTYLRENGMKTAKMFQWNSVIDRLEAIFSTLLQAECKSMVDFFRSRLVEPNEDLVGAYFRDSYGSLPPPSQMSDGFILDRIPSRGNALTFVRLRFWMIAFKNDYVLDTFVPTCIIKQIETASEHVALANARRPDIAGEDSHYSLCGFDVVVPLARRDTRERLRLELTAFNPLNVAEIASARLDCLPEAAKQVDLISEEVDPTGFQISGALESAETFWGFELAIPKLAIYRRQYAFTVKFTSKVSHQFLFYQTGRGSAFDNVGIAIPDPVESANHRISLSISGDGGSDSRLVLLATEGVNIESVRFVAQCS